MASFLIRCLLPVRYVQNKDIPQLTLGQVHLCQKFDFLLLCNSVFLLVSTRYCCPWPWQKVCDFKNFDPHISAIEVMPEINLNADLTQILNQSHLRRKTSTSLRIIHWISTSAMLCPICLKFLERLTLQTKPPWKIVLGENNHKTQITLIKTKIYPFILEHLTT